MAAKRKTAIGRAFDNSVPNFRPGAAPPSQLASTLGDALKGAVRRSQQYGKTDLEKNGTYAKAPDGGTLFTNAQDGSRRQGKVYAKISHNGSTYHVYYGADGSRDVVRVGGKPQAAPTVSAAGSSPQPTTSGSRPRRKLGRSGGLSSV